MAEIKELLVLLTFLRQTRIQKGQKQRSVETLGLSDYGDSPIITKVHSQPQPTSRIPQQDV